MPGEHANAAASALNPALNAIVTMMEPQARDQLAKGTGDGPFAGVPFLIKDLHDAVDSVPMSGGSAFSKDYVPHYNSACEALAQGRIRRLDVHGSLR